jgi:hypothetical protein
MSISPKDARSVTERARDTAGIIGSLKHEGYVPTPEAEAIHAQVAAGVLTTSQAIEIFRERAVALDAQLWGRRSKR